MILDLTSLQILIVAYSFLRTWCPEQMKKFRNAISRLLPDGVDFQLSGADMMWSACKSLTDYHFSGNDLAEQRAPDV
jgi:hypothetical protein